MRRVLPVGLAALFVACGSTPAHRAETPARVAPTPHVADRAALDRETLRCTGSVDSGASLAEVHRHSVAARRCYEAVLADDPSWHVHVRVDVVVERTGEVSYVSVGDCDRSDFASCLEGVMARASFPAVSAGDCAIVAVPYGFSTRLGP